jgi:hypothetical protein
MSERVAAVEHALAQAPVPRVPPGLAYGRATRSTASSSWLYVVRPK